MPSVSSLLRIALAAALLVGAAACASDEPHRSGGGRHFHGDGDGDGDGEHGGWREGRGGGRTNLFISPSGQPFRAAADDPYPVAAWFAAADADHDGRLTLPEFTRDADRFFDQLDANHDGVIDGPEVTVYEHTIAPEILTEGSRSGEQASGQRQWSGGGGGMGGGMGHRGRRGGGGASGGQNGSTQSRITLQGAMPYSLIPLAEPVASADGNFDGRITREEFLAAAKDRFDELDASNQGYLTLSGLPKTPVQSQGARHRKSDGDD